jgi:hypothetical protein
MPGELTLFAPLPADDQGARLLSTILGPGWDTLAGASQGPAMLAHGMLETFNWVALALVSVLFVAVMIQGVAGTACEGVPLGRRYSSLWMPLRFAASLGFLAPVFKGLSVFQVLMLVMIGGSVNLANHLWSGGLEHFVQRGGEMALNAPDDLMDDSEKLGEGLLFALTVQEYYRQRLDLGVSGALAQEVFWPPKDDVPGLLVLTPSAPAGSGLGQGDLGRVLIPCRDDLGEMCRARLAAVRNLIADLQPLAGTLADPDRDVALAESGALSRAVQRYRDGVRPYLRAAGDREGERLSRDLGEHAEAAKLNGWVTAGAYYWTIARLSERSATLLYDTASFSAAAPQVDGGALRDFEAVFDRLQRYLKGAHRPERAALAEKPPAEFPSLGWFGGMVSGALGRQTLSSLVAKLESGDPVPVLSGLGRYLITAAEAVIGVRIASYALAKGTGQTASSLLGQVASFFTGSVTSFIAGSLEGAVLAVGPFLVVISVLLISYGFLLAYFLPALPFILWLAGVLAWLLSVVEALAAAPLWVAAHALPEGEGLAGQAGRQGYLLFLGVLLRPPLMVFGFLVAMGLLNGVGRIVGRVFSVFGFARLGESFLGVSGFLAFAVILGLCSIMACWRLFALAGSLPDRVMGWIGAGARGGGAEEEEARRHQTGYAAAGGVATKMIDSAANPRP